MKSLFVVGLAFLYISNTSAGYVDHSKTCDCLGEAGVVYINTSGVEGGCISENSPSVIGTEFFLDKDSMICGNAEVQGQKSRVMGGCILADGAVFINSTCRGDAIIGGDSEIENGSRVSAGARVFGAILNKVRVRKNVRLNGGKFSNETVDASMSSSTVSADEKDIVSKLGGSSGSSQVDYKALAEQNRDKLLASFSGQFNLSHIVHSNKTIHYEVQNNISSVLFDVCQIEFHFVEGHYISESNSIPVNIDNWYSLAVDDPYGAKRISFKTDVDFANSFDSSIYIGEIDNRSYAGAKVYFYNLSLNKKFTYSTRLNFGNSSSSESNVVRFAFQSEGQRQKFKSTLIDLENNCTSF